MKKNRCIVCGYIYDDAKEDIPFEELTEDWKCPLCGVGKNMFDLILDDEIIAKKSKTTTKIDKDISNAISIGEDNICIDRDIEKCINCGVCAITCAKREDFNIFDNPNLCLNCGQCIQACPMNALKPKSDVDKLMMALKSNKICVAYTSPAVRVSIGELFGLEVGSFEQEKLVGLLKKLGFKYVFDTTFGADLTIMEEASELIDRITNNKNLPMFTSCCPAWIKYAEIFYPEILNNISSCKSPIGMEGMIIKKYFSKIMNIPEERIYTVAITPCTAKKYEISKPSIEGTDLVITVLELKKIIESRKISYDDIATYEFDSVFGEGSGAGVIFGNTGGVTQAVLRTVYYNLTRKNLDNDIKFVDSKYPNVKEATIKIKSLTLNLAIVHEMSQAKPILESVKNGTCKYQFIEIMNCLGGCIGGGGQPKVNMVNEMVEKQKRITSLNKRDQESSLRYSYENLNIIKIYNDYLDHPLSEISKKLLHTKYENKSDLLQK